MTYATAGVHCRARQRGGVADGGAGAAGSDAGDWVSLYRYAEGKGGHRCSWLPAMRSSSQLDVIAHSRPPPATHPVATERSSSRSRWSPVLQFLHAGESL